MEDLNCFLVKTLSNKQSDQDNVKKVLDSIKDDKESYVLNKFNDLTVKLRNVKSGNFVASRKIFF